jgi:hypothetical protein
MQIKHLSTLSLAAALLYSSCLFAQEQTLTCALEKTGEIYTASKTKSGFTLKSNSNGHILHAIEVTLEAKKSTHDGNLHFCAEMEKLDNRYLGDCLKLNAGFTKSQIESENIAAILRQQERYSRVLKASNKLLLCN